MNNPVAMLPKRRLMENISQSQTKGKCWYYAFKPTLRFIFNQEKGCIDLNKSY